MTVDVITRSLGSAHEAVRLEDTYDTSVVDVWEACTEPERLHHWIATVSGDLQLGGVVQAVFTSTWSGALRIDICEAPHHLLLTSEAGTDQETQIEAWLSEEGPKTRLVIEERGVPSAQLRFYVAGWHAHLDDLAYSLADQTSELDQSWSERTPAPRWLRRRNELIATYQARSPR